MSDERLIKIGLAVFACVLIIVAFVISVVGELRGTFHFHLAPELVDLIKWMLGISCGLGVVSGVTSLAVAVRRTNVNEDIDPDAV